MSIILNVVNYFWKLGYNEVAPDLFRKEHPGGYAIHLNLALETFDYGPRMVALDPSVLRFSQRNFVVFEAIDRLLALGYAPERLELNGREPAYDLLVRHVAGMPFMTLRCEIWEDRFDEVAEAVRLELVGRPRVAPLHCLYSSRLKAGLIDRRYLVFNRDIPTAAAYAHGLLEEEVEPFRPKFPADASSPELAERPPPVAPEGFDVRAGVLVQHRGEASVIDIPHGVTKLANALFWNRDGLRRVNLPDTLVSLGGDTFFGCADLEEVSLPEGVRAMGDNPFANCPRLQLKNNSPWFRYSDDVLTDRAATRVIYASMAGEQRRLALPSGLISVGKHAFHKCRSLKEIALPASLRIIENNPFSDCPDLVLDNRSPHFVLRDGALYDSGYSTLFSYELGRDADALVIPEGVRTVGRHSFYSCSRLQTIVLPSSLRTIGYNPFARCQSLRLVNHSPNFVLDDDALYDRARNELIYCSIARTGETFVVPPGTNKIGRSAFFGCTKLREVVLPHGLTTIDRSAFAHCTSLERLVLPDTVSTLGEWAFLNCTSLQNLAVPKHASTEAQTFLGTTLHAHGPQS